MTEPSFPVDDHTLNLLEEALAGAYEVDADGTHTLVGAEFSMNQLLEFYSGYDESKLIPDSEPDLYVYPEPVYHEHDVIRALIAEVRRLRKDND